MVGKGPELIYVTEDDMHILDIVESRDDGDWILSEPMIFPRR